MMTPGTRKNPFLTEIQMAVFEEFGVPVRYHREWRKRHVVGRRCRFCGKPAQTAAHRIPYDKGVRAYHLRPDFLNQPWNLVATCRGCNKKAQWRDDRIKLFVVTLERRRDRQEHIGNR